jgi:hypothetical protein
MTDVNAFLKRTLLVAAISVLPLANIASAHGGGHGSGGSSGSGSGSGSGSSSSSGSGSSSGGHSSSSSSSGHSSSSSNGGHSSVSSSSGHSVSTANAGHSAPSKVSHPTAAADPNNGSQSAMTGHGMHVARVHRAFEEHGSSTGGYNQQNTETNTDEWRRRHPHLLFGFIRY